ncbi:MAG: four helix bundle protein [Bacteroidetes bacterium]|nr:four helix bundle protein [Bacteroidota bacterium]
MKDEFLDIVEETNISYGKINSYKDLLVWQKGMELVKHIYSITSLMPEDEKFGLTSQIRRSAVSVPSNIAEGWGVAVTGRYIHHLKISFGSLCEVETQLTLIENLNYLPKESLSESKSSLQETSKMLRSLIASLERKRNY